MLGFDELYKFKAQRLKSTLIYLIFAGCLIEDLIYGMLTLNFYQLGGGLYMVAEGIQRYIPDFQIAEFVSAHFLLTGSDLLLNSIISVAIIITTLCYYRFSRSGKHNCTVC